MAKKYNKEYVITNFSDYTLKAESVQVANGINAGYEFIKTDYLLPSGVEKIFSVSDKHYFFCKDKFIYFLDKDSASKIAHIQFENPTDIIKFTYSLDERLLVKDGDRVYFIGKTMDVINCPKNTSVLSDKGRIYFYGDNRVYFNDIEDSLNAVYKSLSSNVINVSKQYGKILKIYSYLDYLLIITERAFLKLNVSYSSNDFTLSKICDLDNCPDVSSFALDGEKIMFLSKGKLCVFDGKVSKIDTKFLDGAHATGGAFFRDRIYLVPVLNPTGRYLYLYDAGSKMESLVKCDDINLTSENYFAIKSDKVLYQLQKVFNADKCKWQSIPITFDSDDEKVLCGLKVLSESPVIVGVKGGGADVRFFSTDKRRNLPKGLKDKSFNLEIIGNVLPVNVKKVIFYYNV